MHQVDWTEWGYRTVLLSIVLVFGLGVADVTQTIDWLPVRTYSTMLWLIAILLWGGWVIIRWRSEQGPSDQ